LIGVDTLLILSHEMPKGAMFANTTDYLAFASLFSIYLASMTQGECIRWMTLLGQMTPSNTKTSEPIDDLSEIIFFRVRVDE